MEGKAPLAGKQQAESQTGVLMSPQMTHKMTSTNNISGIAAAMLETQFQDAKIFLEIFQLKQTTTMNGR